MESAKRLSIGLIELVSLGITAEELRAISAKNGDFASTRTV